MSIQTIHGLYAVRLFDSVEASEVVLDGTSEQAVNISNTVLNDQTAGSLYSRFVPLTAQSFSCPVTTRRIKDVLDAIGTSARFFTSDTGKPGVEICWQKYAESSGGRAGSGAHIKHTIAAGCIVPVGLSASHQQDASLSYLVIPKYDGTNEPLVHNASQSLPALVGDNVRYTLGPVTLGGQSVGGNVDVNVNFGSNYNLEGSDSDIWPTFISLVSVVPSITMTGTDAAILASKIPNAGRAMTHANPTIFLKKRAEGGTHFVADATEEHIKLTIAGMAFVQSYSASIGGRMQTGIQLFPKFDGTNAPIVIDTTAAIA